MTLRFLIADTLTGKLVGRIKPTEWSWEDPLTGQSAGTFTVPIPEDDEDDQITNLISWTRPKIRQVVAVDNQDRMWFGGPILVEPARNSDGTIELTVADWRAWFYGSVIRPNSNNTRRDYQHVAAGTGQVEQCQAMYDIAQIAMDTIGAPHLVIDQFTDSGVMRDVTARMFKKTGEALDNIARRFDAPDWWTYMTYDPVDPTTVVAHMAIQYPERGTGQPALKLERKMVLRSHAGAGGNIIEYDWPSGHELPTRVIGVTQDPAPDETWSIAQTPDLEDGAALAWDDVWNLPEGVASAESAFDHSMGRLNDLYEDKGVIGVKLDISKTDLATWGPGDRARVSISDGWRDVELPNARIIGRTLTGIGGDVTGCLAQVNLSPFEVNLTPAEDVEEET